jgi:HSP20 family protein
MPNVEIQKVKNDQKDALPIFQEFEKRFNEIRNRAFDLFENRGRRLGYELDDWLRAEREIFASPPAELADKGNSYELQMELPGFDPKDVQVTATPDEVVIHAAASEEKKSDKADVLWSEFTSRDVYRRIPAPTPLNPDNVTATLEKGVLRITAPKTAELKAKSVAVKAA